MQLLNQVEIENHCLPRRILLYGIPGIGCSAFAAQADSPIFIPTEDGLDHLGCHRLPRCRRFGSVMQALRELHDDPRGYKTVVIDPLEGLETLICDEVCRDRGLENIEEISFSRGYGFAMTYWRGLLRGLETLRRDCGMTVMFVGHARLEVDDENPSTHRRRYIPAVHWRTGLQLLSWCDEVLFATFNWEQSGAHAPMPTGEGLSDTLEIERVLYTCPTTFCVAKNHLKLPPQMSMDFALLAPHLKAEQPESLSQN